MPQKRFKVELERLQKTATMFRVPFDLEEAFGRARPLVEWVEEARRRETRSRRIGATVEHVLESEPQRR